MTVGRRLPTRSAGEPEGWLRTRRGRLIVARGAALLLSLAVPVAVANMREASNTSVDLSVALQTVSSHQVSVAAIDTPAGNGTGTLRMTTISGEQVQATFPAAF